MYFLSAEMERRFLTVNNIDDVQTIFFLPENMNLSMVTPVVGSAGGGASLDM